MHLRGLRVLGREVTVGISITEPLMVWVCFACVVSLTGGVTFVIHCWKERSRKADLLKEENADLKTANASLSAENTNLKEERASQKAENAQQKVEREKLIAARNSVTQQLLIERVTGQAQTRVAVCEAKTEAFLSAKVERELHWEELPGKWWGRNYLFVYRETLWILGTAKPELTIAKFESRIAPETIVSIFGAGVKVVQLTDGKPQS
jgi:hypothetical protein